ncbi:MAG: FAD-dependent oxidoreductase [Chitinophagaceae bacterium]
MQVDYLIIGQGLCGTWLSYYLQKNNKTFVVIDKNEDNTPSKVSAGIINPVTGRRMVKVWMADELWPFLKEAYKEIGEFLETELISPKNIIDFFPNVHHRQVFLERVEERDMWLASFPEQNQFNPFFNYELGCGEIRHCFTVNLASLLSGWRLHLKKTGQLIETEFDLKRLEIHGKSVSWSDNDGETISAEKIIFCDGLNSFYNPYFNQLPFAPNKGEALLVEIPGLPPHYIYKKAFVLAPLPEENLFWLGSNYQWSFPHANPTKEFCQQAENHLKSWLKLPYKIVDHKAAVRPATLERRPFVGLHPYQKQIGILNGMGTKGCSLSPWFAKELANNLCYDEPISPLADANRFQKILSLKN